MYADGFPARGTAHTVPINHTVKLNANRHVVGVLRGFDQFLNIVLDSATDEKTKQELGMVVRGDKQSSNGQQHATLFATLFPRWCAATASSRWSHWSGLDKNFCTCMLVVKPFTAIT